MLSIVGKLPAYYCCLNALYTRMLACFSRASILTYFNARIRETGESPFDPRRLALLTLLRSPLQSALLMCSAIRAALL